MTKGQATLLRAKSQLKVNNRTKTSKAPRSKIKTQNFSSYFQSLELLCSDCAFAFAGNTNITALPILTQIIGMLEM